MNNAFVTPFSAPVQSTASRRVNICSSRPAPTTPFFASTAFGAPVVHRVAPPPVRANVRMDVTIVVGENEPVESALRRFKKDVMKSGHLFELRRRRYFETNTEKRIRKAAAARRKAKMARNDRRAANRQRLNNAARSATSSATAASAAAAANNASAPNSAPATPAAAAPAGAATS